MVSLSRRNTGLIAGLVSAASFVVPVSSAMAFNPQPDPPGKQISVSLQRGYLNPQPLPPIVR